MPLLDYKFQKHNIHLFELGEVGLLEKQIHSNSSPKLEEVDYGRESIAGLYYNEKLITIDSERLPLIKYAEFNDIFSLELKVLNEPFEREFPISAVDKELHQAKIKNFLNGQIISLVGWEKHNDGKLELIGRQAGYHDMLVSNLSQDVDLSTLNKQFQKGQTFRKMEIENGKKIPFKKSFLANTLGAAYLIKVDNKETYLFARRRKTMAVAGGEWSVIGTTPIWLEYFKNEKRKNSQGNIEIGFSFYQYTVTEFREELALEPLEVRFKKGWFVDELYRGPALYSIWETPIDAEEIVERCRKPENVESREEHDYLMFAGPLTSELVSDFRKGIKLRNGEYVLNDSSGLLPFSAKGVSLKQKVILNEPSLALMKLTLDYYLTN